MRYLLALVPSAQHRLPYIQTAQLAFAAKSNGYLLSENVSTPHITVCSFSCSDDSKLTEIWASAQDWHIESCPVRMLGLLLKKGKLPPNHYSVSLSVARDPPILNLHHQALRLLESHGIDSLNPNCELYQPHLTLAGIRWGPSEFVILPSVIDELIGMPMSPFHLSLARGDDIGQYLEALFES